MSLFSRRLYGITQSSELIPPRPTASAGAVAVTNETALRHSAVWACLRLRSNLISTMPIDVFRKVQGIQVEVAKPPVLMNPGGKRMSMHEWMYSTQFDLDRGGNAFGIITEVDGSGLPRRIDLVPLSSVTITVKDGEISKYKISGKDYDPDLIWHEKQYTVAGLPFGLSPVAYAAWSISEYLSIQDFAVNWFGGEAIPAAHLKNTAKTLNNAQAADVKTRYKESVRDGGLFVTGSDWEYSMIQAEQAGADWISAKQYGVADIARFFDCPGDLIDAMVSTGSITYASITQRNLQLLIMHVGPAIIRREDGLGRMVAPPRFVKLNTDALLRMDPKTRADMFKVQIDSRTLAPSEARALEDRQPFTESQLAEFDRVFGRPNSKPQTATTGASNA